MAISSSDRETDFERVREDTLSLSSSLKSALLGAESWLLLLDLRDVEMGAGRCFWVALGVVTSSA